MGDGSCSRHDRKHPGPALCWAIAGAVSLGGGGFLPVPEAYPVIGIPAQTTVQAISSSRPPAEYPSRGVSNSRAVLTVLATGYCACPVCCGRSADGITSTGMKARPGIIAVDPAFIPLYTHLYVEGYGDAIAGDTGSRIRGPHVDLFFNTHQEALNFGRRWVKVYVLPGD